jgi:hypothetical protein
MNLNKYTMARFKDADTSQGLFLTVNPETQGVKTVTIDTILY